VISAVFLHVILELPLSIGVDKASGSRGADRLALDQCAFRASRTSLGIPSWLTV
jgi:hypothetical protein